MAQDLARLLASLNGSKIQSQNNSLYQTIKGLIDAVREFQVDISEESLVQIITGAITPSDTVTDLNGANAPGVSLLYSRGDHKHSIDVSAASRLLGRGDASAGLYQEIILGSGLAMTGTTLSAVGSEIGVAVHGHLTEEGSASPPIDLWVEDGTDWLYADGAP